MKKQPYPITNITKGLDLSLEPSLLEDTASPDIQEVIHDKGLLKKDSAWTALGAPLIGVPIFYDAFYKTDGSVYQVCLTTKAAYYMDTTNREWLDITKGVVIEDCEDVWVDKTYVTSSVPTTYKRGTKSLLLTVTADFTTGILATEVISSANYTTYTYVHFFVKSSIAMAAGDLSLLLDDTNACASPIETLALPALVAGTWTRVSIALAAAASCTAIISVGIQLNNNKGAFTLALDDIRAVKEFTGDEDNNFFSTTLNDTYIITNGVDAIQKWAGGETVFADLAGSPPTKAVTICAFQNRILLGGTTETGTAYPQRLRWSSVGTTETWSGGTSGYIDLVDTVDWITHIKLLEGKCIIYKDYSFWECLYVGGTDIFKLEMRQNNTGTLAPNTIVDLGASHILYSAGNIIEFDGMNVDNLANQLTSLLYETATKEISLATVGRATALYVAETETYWLAFPAESILLKYNRRTSAWVRFNSIDIYGLGYFYATSTPLVWSAATQTWEEITGSWKYRNLAANAPTLLLGTGDGQTYEDDRVSYSTRMLTWVTKDFLFGHASRITEVRVNYRLGGFTIYYSLDGGLTYTSLSTFAYTTDWVEGMKEINVTTQRIRFKITTSELQFELKWLEPWYIARKRSVSLTES